MTIKIIIRLYEYIVIAVVRDVCGATAFREANTRQGATRDCLAGGSDHGGTERAYAVLPSVPPSHYIPLKRAAQPGGFSGN